MAFMIRLTWVWVCQTPRSHLSLNSTLLLYRWPEMVEHDVHHNARHGNVEPDWICDARPATMLVAIGGRYRALFSLIAFENTATECAEAQVDLPRCQKGNGNRQQNVRDEDGVINVAHRSRMRKFDAAHLDVIPNVTR